MSEPNLRTVCHGCRTLRQVEERVADDRVRYRTVIVPGDGTVERIVGDIEVEEPCPVCGDSDTPGWLPGFQPPA